MSRRAKCFFLVLFFFMLWIVPSGALADYSGILSFGDSLTSDNGGSGSSSYGTYSNGPVWVQDLATMWAVSLTDQAVGGATTAPIPGDAASNTNNVAYQIANYSPGVSLTDTLVTVWAGGNDVTAYLALNQLTTMAQIIATANASADNVFNDVQTLANEGFKNFLVPDLPNLGLTTRFYGTPYQAPLTAWCTVFDQELAADLIKLIAANPGDNFYTADAYGLLAAVFADPTAYGFANDAAIFWTDGYHPSAQTQQFFANSVAEMYTPLPAPLLLLGSGLIGLAGVRRRFKN